MSQVSPEEISRLIDSQSRALCLYAAQLCDAPEDVVQESVIALAALARRPDDLVSWLYAVVRNKARMAHRVRRRRQDRERHVAAATQKWFEPALDDRLDADDVRTALLDLDAETREIIVAHVWGELTFEQIAAVVGLSSTTVHRRFVSGLETLREKLDAKWTPNRQSMKT